VIAGIADWRQKAEGKKAWSACVKNCNALAVVMDGCVAN